MEIQKAIYGRRSIRHYKNKPFSDDILTEILQSAIEAPSAGNVQARKYYVVTNQEIKKKLAKASLNQNFIFEAPVAIVVCVDDRIKKRYGSRGTELYAILDCAASIQNMMLTAYAHDLGTCWVGAFDEEAVGKIMNLPENLRVVSILPIGYPDESPERPDRFTIEDVCEFVD